VKVTLGGCQVAKAGSAPQNQLCEPCSSRVSLFTPSRESATYRVSHLAALVSPTGYSSQALGPGQQCINADYNPTLRLPDIVMLAMMSDFELCDPDMESRFLPGPISCAASLPVAFSVPSLTIPDIYYSTRGYFLTLVSTPCSNLLLPIPLCLQSNCL
jgi:hypothetical protein